MSATATPVKRDETIRFRAESELKIRIERVAAKRKKKPAEFLRESLWKLVEEAEPAKK